MSRYLLNFQLPPHITPDYGVDMVGDRAIEYIDYIRLYKN